jgi:hypothetical protein
MCAAAAVMAGTATIDSANQAAAATAAYRQIQCLLHLCLPLLLLL